MAANPPTMYHRTLSSRAGRVVKLALGRGVPESARELMDGFWVLSAADSLLVSDCGMGPVPEIEIASSLSAAADSFMKTLNP